MKNYIKTTILVAALICIPQLQAMQQVKTAAQVSGQSSTLSKLSVAGGVLAALYAGHKWLNQPDTTMPTLESLKVATIIPIKEHEVQDMNKVLTKKEEIAAALKKPFPSELLAMFIPGYKKYQPVEEIMQLNGQYYKIQEGIPAEIVQHKQVTIRSGGCYDPKLYSTYVALKAGNVQGPCIAFSFPTSTRRAFNYCQEQDIHCLELIYQEILKKNPHADIALYGTCKGGTNILRFLAESAERGRNLDNVKAVALESPTISVKHAISQYHIHPFVGLIFPNHKANGKTILDAQHMPAHVPILIGRLENDSVSKFNDTNELVSHLNKVGNRNNVYLMTTKESSIMHGQLGRAKDYQRALNAFYKTNNLLHAEEKDESRQLQSEALLKIAADEANNV